MGRKIATLLLVLCFLQITDLVRAEDGRVYGLREKVYGLDGETKAVSKELALLKDRKNSFAVQIELMETQQRLGEISDGLQELSGNKKAAQKQAGPSVEQLKKELPLQSEIADILKQLRAAYDRNDDNQAVKLQAKLKEKRSAVSRLYPQSKPAAVTLVGVTNTAVSESADMKILKAQSQVVDDIILENEKNLNSLIGQVKDQRNQLGQLEVQIGKDRITAELQKTDMQILHAQQTKNWALSQRLNSKEMYLRQENLGLDDLAALYVQLQDAQQRNDQDMIKKTLDAIREKNQSLNMTRSLERM